MRSLYEVGGEELRWIKPKWFKRQYELRAGDEIVATLMRLGGSGAVGEWSGGRYSFSQKGWINQRIFVRRDPAGVNTEADTPLATFTRRDSVLTLAGGRAFFWKKQSVWRSRRIGTAGVATLVEYDPASGYASPRVTITPEGERVDELPLLLLLDEYLIVRAREDADAASAATTATFVASS